MKNIEKNFRDIMLRIFKCIVNGVDIKREISTVEIQFILEDLGEKELSNILDTYHQKNPMKPEEQLNLLMNINLAVMEQLTGNEEKALEKILLENKEYVTDDETMMVMEDDYDTEIHVKHSDDGQCLIYVPKKKINSVSLFISRNFLSCVRSPIGCDNRIYVLKNRYGLFEKINE